jgi:N-acylglucosamine 2-epimerase
MKPRDLNELCAYYRHCLLDDIIPFWLRYSLDYEYGGYLHCLDRKGGVFSTDKSMWIQCRELWLFSKLYNVLERRKEWLDAARNGFEFIMKYGFDVDGRMFYSVTRDGRPLRKRRYLYTEAFGIIACAEYAKATKEKESLKRAKDTYHLVVDLYRRPGSLPLKVFPETRMTKSHAMPMILLNTTLELSQVDSDSMYKEVIDNALDQITNDFLKQDKRALLETVGVNGEQLDSPEGRCVNPGHAIETSWFIMHEGCRRHDSILIQTALDILDWSLQWGWDKSYGGIFSFVDIEGKPPEQLEWDMKLWWPHTEALYALLLAYHLSGDKRYLSWYEKVHEWTFANFPDPDYGEWFGYLHRDGSVSIPLKGSMWKGPFHLPRMLLQGVKLLEKKEFSRPSPF